MKMVWLQSGRKLNTFIDFFIYYEILAKQFMVNLIDYKETVKYNLSEIRKLVQNIKNSFIAGQNSTTNNGLYIGNINATNMLFNSDQIKIANYLSDLALAGNSFTTQIV